MMARPPVFKDRQRVEIGLEAELVRRLDEHIENGGSWATKADGTLRFSTRREIIAAALEGYLK